MGSPQGMTDSEYELGFWFTFAPVFVGTWIWCIWYYGFLLGVGFGWLPSAIVAFVVALCWPILHILILVCIGVAVVIRLVIHLLFAA